jgi:inosine-uridine nucleoside N-ribohydrolase
MIGLDITHKALFTAEHAERLRPTGPAGKAVAEMADFFLIFHRQRYRFDGAPIHDAMAVAHVIDPTLVTTLECNVTIETQSRYCDGRTVADRWQVLDAPRNVGVGIDVEAERFLDLLVERISLLSCALPGA